jgi:LPS O-antigen subunit length determinant protein (WzzB/FepE family)
MLASANDAYVFKIIDSPIEAEIKSSPNRILIVILGTIVGLIMSMLIACIGWFRSLHSI